jgi:hypothetical protein
MLHMLTNVVCVPFIQTIYHIQSNLPHTGAKPLDYHITGTVTGYFKVKQSRNTPWRRLGGRGGVARTHS